MEAGIEALLHETRLALWAATYTTQCIAMCQALLSCWGKQSPSILGGGKLEVVVRYVHPAYMCSR